MTIPVALFEAVILVALALVCMAPAILVVLLLRDWRRKQLW